MAATAAYFSVTPIPAGPGIKSPRQFVNIGATTSAFALTGGRYGLKCKASTYGTVTLQVLADDGVTWLSAVTAFAADGVAVSDLPPGSYRVALA